MNLIDDCWLPVVRADGSKSKIAPWQIAETNNPVSELAAPRLDFQGALYQFLIGLLQTTFAPEDTDEWIEYWPQPPEIDILKGAFSRLTKGFELDNPDAPAFMQDFDLEHGEHKSIAALLIESPGSQAVKNNLDHFIKRGQIEHVCLACAATALFVLQTNAPSGGVGHRVGIRGGGPLTTLVIPQSAETLWQKLWVNVLTGETQEELTEKATVLESSIFPWLAPTRCSNREQGTDTHPVDVHPLQQYWGMPRRIRLCCETLRDVNCSICGQESARVVESYITKNYGINYAGSWVHSLTPYRHDPKKKNLPLSLKGQQGGLGYRHWLGLVWQDSETGEEAAKNVRQFNEDIGDKIGESEGARLWCFGYDMNKMKARCWYEHILPVLHIPVPKRAAFLNGVARLISSAKEAVSILRSQVKAAWFSRPKDVKGDMNTVVYAFWQQTEETFFTQLYELAQMSEDAREISGKVAKEWLAAIRKTTLKLFDQAVLEVDAEDINMKQVVQARNKLERLLRSAKPFRALRQIAQADKEELT